MKDQEVDPDDLTTVMGWKNTGRSPPLTALECQLGSMELNNPRRWVCETCNRIYGWDADETEKLLVLRIKVPGVLE